MSSQSECAALNQAIEQARLAAENAHATIGAAAANTDYAASAVDNAQLCLEQAGKLSALMSGPSDFIYLLALFVLAIFVGYYVVWSVTPALHTPLMSVTNAISSVVIVGALIAVGAQSVNTTGSFVSKILGFLAVALASVNIFGGFLVTQRMLAMYKKKG